MSIGDILEDLRRYVDEDDPDLQDILVDALKHPAQAVRAFAAINLAEQFQDARAAPVLAEILESGRPKEVRAAASALWEIGDGDSAGLLRSLVLAPVEERDAVGNALYWIGWVPDDPDNAVTFFILTHQWRASIALGAEAVSGLVSALEDWDGTVRRGSAWALGEIGDPRAVPWLVRLLEDTSGDLLGVGGRVCDIAAEALEKIGTPEARAALLAWRSKHT